LSVPVAVPDPPLELNHVTAATPTLSWAVPRTTNELSEVDTLLVAGERIVRDGGVVSVPGVGFVAALRVIVRRCVADFAANHGP
jgi:hypothetical protein